MCIGTRAAILIKIINKVNAFNGLLFVKSAIVLENKALI